MLSIEDIELYFGHIGVTLTIREATMQKEPAWAKGGEGYGIQYIVTFKRKDDKRRFSYSFWGSLSDREDGEELQPETVVETLLADRHCPETFEDFCSEFSYEQYDEDTGRVNANSRRTFKACLSMSQKIKAFFSEEELEQLDSDEPLPVPTERGEIGHDTGYDESVLFKVNLRLL